MTATRLGYTTNLPTGDPLNGGRNFYARYLSTFRDELLVLVVLWFFWIIGASIASFNPCRVLSALEAFSWLGWVALTMLVVVNALFGFANKAFLEPLHGRWDPRASTYNPSSKV
ncbi:hypothetical protein C0995_005136 [Termitomyces sp. Mi166|nr:hypothetical protein C0995_005136 [Termitomyces sp. Mi166\